MSETTKEQNQKSPQPTANQSRRSFLKYTAAGAVGVGIASAVEIPLLTNVLNSDTNKMDELSTKVNQLNSQISQDQTQINSLNSQVSSQEAQISNLQGQVASNEGLATLSVSEFNAISAIAETIIPSDSNGPGAKEAGVVYFIDKQLDGVYGNAGRMYMKGPFVLSGQKGPITVDGITYSEGSPTESFPGPTYQYNMTPRFFWRYGIEALEAYSNQAYGNNYEKLSADSQIQVLQDLNDDKPTNFNNIVPHEFLWEIIFMVYSGYFADPLYGGNRNMVAWTYTGFTGANMGDSFGEGRDVLKLMVADKPTRFAPHSLGQFQKQMGFGGS